MSFVTIHNKFHIALNGKGLLLEGTDKRPAYQQAQAPVYGNRFAMGDRGYTDFSFWWYWAQTDFSGGIKSDERWADDGMYHSSANVTPIKIPGVALLNVTYAASSIPVGDDNYGKSITYRAAVLGSSIYIYLIGRNDTDGTVIVVNATTMETVVEGTATGVNEIGLCGDNGYFGCKTVVDDSSMVKTISGGAFVDVGALNTGTGVHEIIFDKDKNKLWAFTYDAGIYEYDIATTTWTQRTTTYPLGAANATSLSFYKTTSPFYYKPAVLVAGKIYFSKYNSDGGTYDLWSFDTEDYTYAFIAENIDMRIAAERFGIIYYYRNLFTVPQIWKYDTSTGIVAKVIDVGRYGDTKSIYHMVNYYDDIYFVSGVAGANLVVDVLDKNEVYFSGREVPTAFATSDIDSMGRDLTLINNDDDQVALLSGLSTSGWLATSIFDAGVPSIDKLYYSATITFDKLIANQSITVSYSLDNGSTFTELGSASHTNDGGSITEKELIFGTSVTSKTIQLKFTLAGGGGNTPSFNSFSVQYIPIPDYKKIWNLTVNCGDEVKRLDGRLVEDTGRETKSILETAWWTKEILDYQDLDYATTLINDATLEAADVTITVDSTKDFPEQGRFHIDDEEILYTGKTPTTFTGCTRGARGTIAADHANNAVVNNAYKVLITDFKADIPVMNEGNDLEYRVGLSIREA